MPTRAVLLVIAVAGILPAQLPEFYKKVDRVTWIVPDLDKTVAAWRKAGVETIVERGELSVEVTFRGKVVKASWRAANARVGDLWWDWVQPVSDNDAFAEFLRASGGGVMALMHRAPTLGAFNAEIERLRALGVLPLQLGELGPVRFAYFDTRAEGKYVLGLQYLEQGEPDPPAPGPFRITQFAFVAKDAEPASSYWARIGFPKMAVTQSTSTNRRYRGAPAEFEMKLGWHRHGRIVYEWALPLKGPSTYDDHLRTHGEGFHHFGVGVDDMDAAIARWESLGYKVAQSGGWGETGKPGSGRFAYIDTDPIGGALIELLWNYRVPPGKK
ncbi:MAG: VOC family protein [Acidobacteria bacterium]|nr:VOC family protein [Acidobacteriota bacterium]